MDTARHEPQRSLTVLSRECSVRWIFADAERLSEAGFQAERVRPRGL